MNDLCVYTSQTGATVRETWDEDSQTYILEATADQGDRAMTDDTKGRLILDLCHEAGDDGTEAEILEGWLANHEGCCEARLSAAAEGDAAAIIAIRRCMGLPITR